jgi:hypothetical protein
MTTVNRDSTGASSVLADRQSRNTTLSQARGRKEYLDK